MKHYVKNMWDFSKQNSIPTFECQRESFSCPHCNERVLVAVPTTGVDWEKVATDYKGYCDQLWTECNVLLMEAGLDTLLESKLKSILERCKKHLI